MNSIIKRSGKKMILVVDRNRKVKYTIDPNILPELPVVVPPRKTFVQIFSRLPDEIQRLVVSFMPWKFERQEMYILKTSSEAVKNFMRVLSDPSSSTADNQPIRDAFRVVAKMQQTPISVILDNSGSNGVWKCIDGHDEYHPRLLCEFDTACTTIMTQPLSLKLYSASIDTLIHIYQKEFGRRFSNMKCSSIPLEKRKKTIITGILKQVNTQDLSRKIMTTYFEEPKKEKATPSWIQEFVVGDEVLVNVGTHWSSSKRIKSVVTKINAKSVTVRLYAYRTIDDDNAFRNQTYGKDRLIWTELSTETKTLFSRHDLIKRGEYSFYDNLFVEGEHDVDFSS